MYVSIVSPRLSRPVLDRPTRRVDRYPLPLLHVARTAHTDRPPAAQLFYSVIVASPHFTSHTWETREEKAWEKKLYKSQASPRPHFRVWPFCRAILLYPSPVTKSSALLRNCLLTLTRPTTDSRVFEVPAHIYIQIYIVTSHRSTHLCCTHTHTNSPTRGPPQHYAPRPISYVQPRYQHVRQGAYRARQPLLLDLL